MTKATDKLKVNRKRIRERRNPKGHVLPILTGDQLTDKPCRDATENDLKIIPDMIATLLSQPLGVGLAAPQVGHNVNIFVVRLPKMFPMAFINCVITERSIEKETKVEGCLSYPGLEADVERHMAIWLEGYGQGMRKLKQAAFRVFSARVIQHEMDHLNGFCLVGMTGTETKETEE